MSVNTLSQAPAGPRPAPAGRQVVVVASPPATAPTLRVLAADPDPAARDFYRATLPRLGHQVQVVAGGADVAAACRLLKPDLVLTAPDGLAAAGAACREDPVPVVLVADSFEPLTVARALAAEWVMACLARPVGEAGLGAALALAARRFEQLRALRAEVAELKQALEDRKVIERAKGVVTRRCGVNEDVAYRRMRKVASHANRKMADLAVEVLAAEAVFANLEAADE